MEVESKTVSNTVNSGVRICVECGSERIIFVGLKEIKCQNCGSSKSYSDHSYGAKFKKGDKVRIVDSENSSFVYTIERISKSFNGVIYYLLKSDSKMKILYHESKESHLEKA